MLLPRKPPLQQSWKLPVGGSKPELWERIHDQVSIPEDVNDQVRLQDQEYDNEYKVSSEMGGRIQDLVAIPHEVDCQARHLLAKVCLTFFYDLRRLVAVCPFQVHKICKTWVRRISGRRS